MSGHRPFSELTEHFTPEQRQRIEKKKAEMRAEMALHEVRNARALTQKTIAEALHVKQPAVAKLERRTDMYVSNLRSYIEAAGGRLKIIAEFPECQVAITNFAQAGAEETSGAEVAATVQPRLP